MRAKSGREAIGAASRPATSSTRLRGWPLLVARIGWPLVFAVTVYQFALSLPGYRATIERPSPDTAALSPGAIAALGHAGITLDAYAWASVVIVCLGIFIAAALALLLFWLRGNDWMALLASLFILVYTAGNLGVASNGPVSNPDFTLAVALGALEDGIVFAIAFGVFLCFPSGQFVPRWSWVLLAAAAVWIAVLHAQPNLLGGALYLGYPLFYGAAIACIVYRYRRAMTPVQRQQTKWVVAGMVATLIANQAFWLPSGFTPLGQTLYAPIFYLVYQVVLLLVPLTFFIAIQRYRLYDIDVIIRRTLVYGTLTTILAGVYLLLVLGAQAVVYGLSGQRGDEPIIIVASTLLIAALFNPLRRRIQRTIDRRFYRRKYDAAKTLAAFGASLRTQTDLSALSGHLLDAVEETMQPAHASLWLRTPSSGQTPRDALA